MLKLQMQNIFKHISQIIFSLYIYLFLAILQFYCANYTDKKSRKGN